MFNSFFSRIVTNLLECIFTIGRLFLNYQTILQSFKLLLNMLILLTYDYVLLNSHSKTHHPISVRVSCLLINVQLCVI